jgi:hypothetical protein
MDGSQKQLPVAEGERPTLTDVRFRYAVMK